MMIQMRRIFGVENQELMANNGKHLTQKSYAFSVKCYTR